MLTGNGGSLSFLGFEGVWGVDACNLRAVERVRQ